MNDAARWWAKPELRWALAVFLVALCVRLVFVWYVHPSPRDGRYDDSVFYDSAARHLAAGDGYVFDPGVFFSGDGQAIYPDEHALTATALKPPGYPATLAVVYKLTGNSQWAGRLFNVLVGALTPVLIFLVARRLFDLAAAACAGFALALLPSHVMFTPVLTSETLFGFLLALTLAICVYFVFPGRRPSLPLIAGLGALVAFTGYVRGEFLAFGGVIALLLLVRYRRDAAAPLAALALGAAVVVVPWAVRNQIQMGRPIIGTTGSGRLAYQGHNPTTNGSPSLDTYFALERPYAGDNRTDIEVNASEDGWHLGRTFAWEHKRRELQLLAKRVFLLFKNDTAAVQWIQSDKPWFGKDGANKAVRLSDFTFYGLIGLALAGALFWWRPRDLRMWVVLAIVPLYFVVFGVIFVGDPRYHYALYVPLAIFAGPALSELGRMTAERWREVMGAREIIPVPYGRPER